MYDKHVKYVEASESTGAMSRGFTSTTMLPMTKNERRLIRLDRNPKTKGYLQMHTSCGDLNIELHCDIVPRTSENFFGLCAMSYYDGVLFHRSIKNFMVQGGDPTGTGKGGESIYGPTFKDEMDSRLTHSGRGVLSMANSGPNPNGSQFFILYKSAHHLDFKHTVFGRVVGGFETLSTIEKIDTDDDDRPVQEVKILGVSILKNPFQEMIEEETREEQANKLNEVDDDKEKGLWFSDPAGRTRELKQKSVVPTEAQIEGELDQFPKASVGRYLKLPTTATSVRKALGAKKHGGELEDEVDAGEELTDKSAKPQPRKKTRLIGHYGNFNAW